MINNKQNQLNAQLPAFDYVLRKVNETVSTTSPQHPTGYKPKKQKEFIPYAEILERLG
ncbi:hypothetical protein [Parabacteroides sp. PF5-9]|uniref:hypothetical protein n=1 Tax=Parabacteroides sp. PF5-9 TaxID=1742404 RepID=UPI0024770B5C|nr:hypothetical protein [Parabacteroides sp. PF5-9]MDH6357707.1 hypothetical protein [Parabacteroides sp. PF5-9]